MKFTSKDINKPVFLRVTVSRHNSITGDIEERDSWENLDVRIAGLLHKEDKVILRVKNNLITVSEDKVRLIHL